LISSGGTGAGSTKVQNFGKKEGKELSKRREEREMKGIPLKIDRGNGRCILTPKMSKRKSFKGGGSPYKGGK